MWRRVGRRAVTLAIFASLPFSLYALVMSFVFAAATERPIEAWKFGVWVLALLVPYAGVVRWARFSWTNTIVGWIATALLVTCVFVLYRR
jgi:hypothetical protein